MPSGMSLSSNFLIAILLQLPGCVLAVTLHEYAKARCSTAFGDPKPRADGRLTLNPLKHIEPIGFVLLCIFGMGWGKPVAMLPSYYDPVKRRKAIIITHILPVVVNLLIGLVLGVCAAGLHYMLPETGALRYLYIGVLGAARVNLSFALVQCIPVYPMAGERVLCQFLKPNTVVKMTQYQFIWQILLMLGIVSGYIAMVVNPICNLLLTIAQ